MDYTTLGRTGLRVSVMGLGCGGHSRLGLSYGRSEDDASAIVRRALDLGINFVDTAEYYGTESAVGAGIQGVARDRVVLSTKAGVDWQDRRSTAAEMRERVHACLGRLGTDYVDVFHLHGVSPDEYDYASAELVPELQRLRDEGKVRHVGITEAFASDPGHRMLVRALDDDWWDVMMVGFSVLNQSARDRVLVRTREKGIGTLCMFAVRRALSQPAALAELWRKLRDDGLVQVPADEDDPMGFLVEDGTAASIPEAAYRFCRYEPGIDVVLSGTGSAEHLALNAAALNRPPLPESVVEKLGRMFAGIDCVSGN